MNLRVMPATPSSSTRRHLPISISVTLAPPPDWLQVAPAGGLLAGGGRLFGYHQEDICRADIILEPSGVAVDDLGQIAAVDSEAKCVKVRPRIRTKNSMATRKSSSLIGVGWSRLAGRS